MSLEGLVADLGAIPHTIDPQTLRLRSRDQYAISPLLREALTGKVADIMVSPRNKADMVQVIRAAVRHNVPITARGGGTANYGQSVPLHGGILLDMKSVAGVLWVRDGAIRAMAGTIMKDIDAVARPQGWELRMHPSTTATATIAGYIAAAAAVWAAANGGMLRDRGNITAIEVLSIEAQPRTIELRGRDVDLVHHAYGANALMTEIEMPAAPAYPWREVIVALPDFVTAVRFGVELAHDSGIVKKLISLQEAPAPTVMRVFADLVPEGCTMANCMIAAGSMDAVRDLVADHGGTIVSDQPEGHGPYHEPSYEFAFGHGLRQMQKADLRYTALQAMWPARDLVGTLTRAHTKFVGRMPMRLEIFRSEGEIVGMGSPYILFENEAQMVGLVHELQELGADVANSHTTGVREVGIKQIGDRDLAFKKDMDPGNLLNPGKLDFDQEPGGEVQTNLPTSGWSFKRAS